MSDAGFGNLMPAPGYSYVNEITPKEILYSTVGLNQKGMTLAANQGLLEAGQVMARRTSTHKWEKYNDGGSDGLNVARGFLRDTVDTTGQDWLGNIVLKGTLRNSKLVGVDSNAIADLNARVDTVLDLFEF